MSSTPKQNVKDRAKSTPRSKNLPWFQANIGSSLTPEGRQLLEEYSGIPPEEVVAHIYNTRDIAWEVFPWPCVGEFWFTSLGFVQHPFYSTLLDRLCSTTPPPKYLDLGTCLGQDLRKLAFDGAPQEALYGTDLFPEYEAIGHGFFRDEDRFKDRFITGDLFDESPDSALGKTKGTWDIVSIVMFLHIWDWDTQVAACKRILKLLKPGKGGLIVGAQTGSTAAKSIELKPPYTAPGEERKIFRHNLESFRKMWGAVQEGEGVSLKLEVSYDSRQERDKLVKEQETGERNFFFPPSDAEVKLFFTVEVL